MLTTIREKTQGIIATFILLLVVIPFALWGINSYFGSGSTLNVAKAGDVDISQTAYRRCEECKDEAACGIRALMQDVRDTTAKILERHSLADVVRREEQLEQKRKKVLSYAI